MAIIKKILTELILFVKMIIDGINNDYLDELNDNKGK